MDIDLSVIIPVFNSESFLRQCLNSILAQEYCSIEVICVDDHSNDRSVDILSEYQMRDRRVIVIHSSENLGAGRCRNLGLERARGEYLLFMDSDDWLFPDSLAKVLEKARRHCVDVLRCRAADYDNQSGKNSLSSHNSLKKIPFFLFDRVTDCRSSCAALAKICVAPWGGLVRRGFLFENKIRFNNLVCVNDRSFFWETVLKAKRIVLIRDFLVHYRTNLDTSLVGGRIRNFACHFESYRLVRIMCASLPKRDRRRILDAELLDMAHWAEQGAVTEYAGEIRIMLRQFLGGIDSSPWNMRIESTVWYRRITRML